MSFFENFDFDTVRNGQNFRLSYSGLGRTLQTTTWMKAWSATKKTTTMTLLSEENTFFIHKNKCRSHFNHQKMKMKPISYLSITT